MKWLLAILLCLAVATAFGEMDIEIGNFFLPHCRALIQERGVTPTSYLCAGAIEAIT